MRLVQVRLPLPGVRGGPAGGAAAARGGAGGAVLRSRLSRPGGPAGRALGVPGLRPGPAVRHRPGQAHPPPRPGHGGQHSCCTRSVMHSAADCQDGGGWRERGAGGRRAGRAAGRAAPVGVAAVARPAPNPAALQQSRPDSSGQQGRQQMSSAAE